MKTIENEEFWFNQGGKGIVQLSIPMGKDSFVFFLTKNQWERFTRFLIKTNSNKPLPEGKAGYAGYVFGCPGGNPINYTKKKENVESQLNNYMNFDKWNQFYFTISREKFKRLRTFCLNMYKQLEQG